jgi:hypothetical protein
MLDRAIDRLGDGLHDPDQTEQPRPLTTGPHDEKDAARLASTVEETI